MLLSSFKPYKKGSCELELLGRQWRIQENCIKLKKMDWNGVRVPGGLLDPPMGTIHEPYPRMFLFRLIYWANGQEKDIFSATHEPRQVKDNRGIDK